MQYRRVTAPVISALVASFLAGHSMAASALKPAKSNGIEMGVAAVSIQSGQIVVQIVATNTNKTRVYLRDAIGDNAQHASLGTGAQLSSAQVSGVDYCPTDAAGCKSSVPDRSNPDAYSYIEPGDTLAFSMSWGAVSPAPSDTISFSVAMVGSITSADEEPDQLGKLNSFRFSFPFVPLASN